MCLVAAAVFFSSLLLCAACREISEELNKMRNKERYMNNQFTALCHEYKEVGGSSFLLSIYLSLYTTAVHHCSTHTTL
jgi:hypothetical protein